MNCQQTLFSLLMRFAAWRQFVGDDARKEKKIQFSWFEQMCSQVEQGRDRGYIFPIFCLKTCFNSEAKRVEIQPDSFDTVDGSEIRPTS